MNKIKRIFCLAGIHKTKREHYVEDKSDRRKEHSFYDVCERCDKVVKESHITINN